MLNNKTIILLNRSRLLVFSFSVLDGLVDSDGERQQSEVDSVVWYRASSRGSAREGQEDCRGTVC